MQLEEYSREFRAYLAEILVAGLLVVSALPIVDDLGIPKAYPKQVIAIVAGRDATDLVSLTSCFEAALRLLTKHALGNFFATWRVADLARQGTAVFAAGGRSVREGGVTEGVAEDEADQTHLLPHQRATKKEINLRNALNRFG